MNRIIGIAATLSIAASTLTATTNAVRLIDKQPPAWFHWAGTSDQHKHHPCILTWGGKGQRKAEICSDGYAVAK